MWLLTIIFSIVCLKIDTDYNVVYEQKGMLNDYKV